MFRLKVLILIAFFSIAISAQETEANEATKIYRAEREKVNNIVHTKLKVKFDFEKQHLIGEEWITLKPHFYNTNSVSLDAKAMLIHSVSRNGKALKYDYDGQKLNIILDNVFVKDEEYTLYISYTARPEEVTQEGSAAINDAKGLYFIDPLDTDPNKPTQIWTQGETESNSCWFPTIDSPNQKTTQEIYITVPNKYVTLSNGILENSSENNDGTRTDYWKLNQKHAPYLFFMGVGEFSVVKDTWNGIPVDYYVEKEYEPYAKEIFGDTPEMLTFFSELLDYKFPWPKYAQIACRDYVSGAMENTTAVIHGETVQQTTGQLIDENTWENTIVHEVFHHWFGDLVTTESWSNLTLNESFASYSEYLWREYKHGKDHADAHRYSDLQTYLNGSNDKKDLVRFHYNSREDMFDAVSYNKGGYILHMLRNYLGDKAFFKGLNLYLKTNEYGTGEAHQLRLSLEEVSGKDLNWFFNQWYFGAGHPKLAITYDYDKNGKSVTVNIKQKTDNVFEFPLAIDVYENNQKKRYKVWVKNKDEQFSFKYNTEPQLINVDADKILVSEIEDAKSVPNYIFQYNNKEANYLDRREAVLALASNQSDETAHKTILKALKDSYHGIRILALDNVKLDESAEALKIVEDLAANDEKTLVKAKAIELLSKLSDSKYIPLYKEALNSKSYSVQSNALSALYPLDKQAAIAKANSITDKLDKKGLAPGLIEIYIKEQNTDQMPFIADKIISGLFFNQDQNVQALYGQAFQWIALSDNLEANKIMVNDFVTKAKQFKAYGADTVIKQMLEQVVIAKQQLTSENKQELIEVVSKGLAEIK